FTNALSAAAVKASYESNADTYAFNGIYKSKLDKISIASVIDLDVVKTTANTALANAATAQTAANNANAAASAAQTTANTGVTAAAAAQTSANNAATAAAAAQATANGKEDSYNEVTENFTALVGAANTDVQINLSQPVKAGHALQVFFNGLRVKTVTNTAGTNLITFRVPYVTEATDDIIVTYVY
ncbi:MAG: hypothetical protein Q8M15_15935, partial [Bacteroidota bacterium]|nr:hypothetical protein [Bacteroidota bacterium]